MIDLLAYLSPLAFLAAAASSFLRPGRRPAGGRVAEGAALVALAGAIAAGAVLWASGPATLGPGYGLAMRLDVVSVTMLTLVSFVGWVVLRYSRTAMDGEARQGAFAGWICLTLAGVCLVVTAGHLVQLVLAWVATSAGLKHLLLWRAERPGARRAVAKKRFVARLSDSALALAAALLAAAYDTGEIAAILSAAQAGEGGGLGVAAAVFLALAAVLKSAQWPLHGWLTQVMEAPTPVSALLHAGLINAGGFLLVRFADVMLLAPGVLAALVLLGGATALVGSLAMLAQPAVKTSLAWSTVAQMGFMTFQCGLALFPLALLHIVAHSLYKAHAFLAAGGAVERVTGARRPGPVATPGLGAVARAFGLALAIYAVVAMAFGIADKSPQAVALGAILVFGVAYLIAQGLADAAPKALTRLTALYAFAASVGYLTLQRLAEALTSATLPPTPSATPLEWAMIVTALLSFGAVAAAQALLPHWAHHPSVAGLRVHLANGFYADALVDRLIGTWTLDERSRA